MNRLSIVTATYNNGETLPLLYTSLLRQKELFDQWIVCDDGSTDETYELVTSYKFKNEFPIQSIRQEHKGMRLAKNINKGLSMIDRGIVFIVMGDSYLQKDTLYHLTESYMLGTAGCGYRENVDIDGTWKSHDWRIPCGTDEIEIVGGVEPWTRLTGNSMIADIDDLKEIGLWDEEYEGYGRDDWDVFMRLKYNYVPLYQYNNVKINHVYHGLGQPDNPNSVERFNKKKLLYAMS